MDDRKYTELLALQRVELAGGTPFCPEDQEIAEYFEGLIPKNERGRLEHHLVDCRYCLARVGMLSRLEQHQSDRRIPGDVLATAKAMAPAVRGRWQKMAPAWAAAALIVLAIGTLPPLHYTRQIKHESQTSANVVESIGMLRETRNINSAVKGPSFLDPIESLVIVPEDYLFRWTPVPNSRFYQVRIVSDSGDVLWQERINGTEWKIPAGTQLTPGADYFMRVEAFLADTRSLKSGYLLFQVEGRR
jgi:hypothetical protein